MRRSRSDPKQTREICSLQRRTQHEVDPRVRFHLQHCESGTLSPRKSFARNVQNAGALLNTLIDLKILVLLFVANGAPVLAKYLLRHRFEAPLDGGLNFLDGRPLFGPSKTVRGLSLALVLSSAAAPMMGLEWTTGLFVAVGAMLGDLFSSFLKRRMQIRTSGRAVGLDQLPEAVFPLLICMLFVPISLLDVVVMTAIFSWPRFCSPNCCFGSTSGTNPTDETISRYAVRAA